MSVADGGNLDYAYARTAARQGVRPDAVAWGRLETARDLGPMLDAARTSGLRAWTAGIAEDLDAHVIERTLRDHWRALARELGQWMPARWRPSVAWFALVVELPAIDALARARPLPSWMDADVHGRAALDGAVDACRPFHGLSAPHAWREVLKRRLPSTQPHEASRFDDLLRILSNHESSMREAPPGDATRLVQGLRDRLRILRRRVPLEATLVFVFLTESALDLSRFRGEIMRRRLFARRSFSP